MAKNTKCLTRALENETCHEKFKRNRVKEISYGAVAYID